MLACVQTAGRTPTVDPTTADQVLPELGTIAVAQLPRAARRRIGRTLADQQARLAAIEIDKAARLAEVEVGREQDRLAEERRVHALQVDDEERERAARLDAAAQDQDDTQDERKRSRRYEWFARRRSFGAMIAIVTLSLATAIPSQVIWFTERLKLATLGGVLGVTLALLIELLCWLGAFLYADAVDDEKPELARMYRILTWVFASVAATINFAHGLSTNLAVGIGYAIASLMGVGAFEVYMHRTRHRKSGLTAAQIKLLYLRRWKFRRVVQEQAKLRATYGLDVDDEILWRMAFVRIEGQPTVPVPASSALLRQLLEDPRTSANTTAAVTAAVADLELTPEPSSRELLPGEGDGAVLTEEPPKPAKKPAKDPVAVEVAASWEQAEDVGAIIARFWPDVASFAADTAREQIANSTPDLSGEIDESSANAANSESELPADPYAAIEEDADDTVPLKTRLRAYYVRVRSLGVLPEDLDWKPANSACGGSERYAQMALKEYRAELDANTPKDPSQGGGQNNELR